MWVFVCFIFFFRFSFGLHRKKLCLNAEMQSYKKEEEYFCIIAQPFETIFRDSGSSFMISELSPALDQIIFTLNSFQMIFVYNWGRKAFAEFFICIWELQRKQPDRKFYFIGKRLNFSRAFSWKGYPVNLREFCKIYLFVSIYSCLTSVQKLLGRIHSFELLRQP